MKNMISRSAPVGSGCGVTSGLVSKHYGEGGSPGYSILGCFPWAGPQTLDEKGCLHEREGRPETLKTPLFRIFGMASALLDISEPQGTPCRLPHLKLFWWALGAADMKDTGGGGVLLGYVLGFPR